MSDARVKVLKRKLAGAEGVAAMWEKEAARLRAKVAEVEAERDEAQAALAAHADAVRQLSKGVDGHWAFALGARALDEYARRVEAERERDGVKDERDMLHAEAMRARVWHTDDSRETCPYCRDGFECIPCGGLRQTRDELTDLRREYDRVLLASGLDGDTAHLLGHLSEQAIAERKIQNALWPVADAVKGLVTPGFKSAPWWGYWQPEGRSFERPGCADSDGGYWVCWYCDCDGPFGGGRESVVHDDDCPAMAVEAALADLSKLEAELEEEEARCDERNRIDAERGG